MCETTTQTRTCDSSRMKSSSRFLVPRGQPVTNQKTTQKSKNLLHCRWVCFFQRGILQVNKFSQNFDRWKTPPVSTFGVLWLDRPPFEAWLVDGFNPFLKEYWSNWIISPNRDEHKKIFETTTQLDITLVFQISAPVLVFWVRFLRVQIPPKSFGATATSSPATIIIDTARKKECYTRAFEGLPRWIWVENWGGIRQWAMG